MARVALIRLAWPVMRGVDWARRRFGRWGLWSLLALLLMALSIPLLRSQKHHLAALQSTLASQPQPPPLPAAAPGPSRNDAAQARFEQLLVAPDALPEALEALLRPLAGLALSMPRAEYQWRADVAGNFARLSISLPVSGAITDIVRFVQMGLQQQPALALEGMQIARKNPASDQVDARLQLSLLLRLPAASNVTGVAGAPNATGVTGATGAPGGSDVIALARRDGIDADPPARPLPFGSAAWLQPAAARTSQAALAQAAPPSSIVAAPSPQPQFTVLGRYEEAGRRSVFVQLGQQYLIARSGAMLGPDHRVDSLTDTSMVLRHLATGQLLVLDLASQP